MVGGSQRVMIGVDLQGGGFGQSVERGLLLDLLLLGLCVLCVVLGLPRPFAEELVQGFGHSSGWPCLEAEWLFGRFLVSEHGHPELWPWHP